MDEKKLDPVKPGSPQSSWRLEEHYRRVLTILAMLGAMLAVVFIVALMGYVAYLIITDPSLKSILTRKVAVALGVPGAIVTALIVVQLLRGLHGPIELQIGSIHFSGATGPVILWILVFLATIFAIWLLWSVDLN